VTAGGQPELREHVPVVLLGHHGLIARLPVVAIHDRGDRLGGIARDAQLGRRATGQRREPVARRRLVRHLSRPQVIGRLVVDVANLGDEGLEHRRGLHTVVAALEVDVVGLESVLRANRRPEGFVPGQLFRRQIRESRPDAVSEQEAKSGRCGRLQKLTLVHRW
jgi:hypothetical protein